jgi:hypothetical protein
MTSGLNFFSPSQIQAVSRMMQRRPVYQVQNPNACQPLGAPITQVKPYVYIVQPFDLSNFWRIPEKFNMPVKIGSTWTWHQLRNANLDWPKGFVDFNGACMLNGLQAGDKLKVPANWRDPKAGVQVQYVPASANLGPGFAGAPTVRRRMPMVQGTQGPQFTYGAPTVHKRMPMVQAVAPRWFRPVLTDSWDDMHPEYAGRYIMFWTKKLLQWLPEVPVASSGLAFSGLGKRLAADPATEARVMAWLRSSFSGPAAFILAAASKPNENPNDRYSSSRGLSEPTFTFDVPPPYDPRFFTWNYPPTKLVAIFGCKKFMNHQCLASAGRPYNEITGECSMYSGGTFGAPRFTQQQSAPRVLVPVRRPQLGLSITWDTKHPNWPGSFISFWSKRIREGLQGVPKAGSAYDMSPLGKRVANDPNCEIKLIAWLRDRWSGPQAFVQYLPGSPNTLPTYAQLGSYTWGSPTTYTLARFASVLYLNSVCQSAGPGFAYDVNTGECAHIPSLPGKVINEPYV